jgi:hypothetical protein
MALALIGFSTWWAMYPEPWDAKGPSYVLWKIGLWPISKYTLGAMVGDANRDNMVIGLTKSQLIKKFGYCRTLDQASAYLQTTYRRSPWSGKDVLFLKDSTWMVIFDGGVAIDLILVKG